MSNDATDEGRPPCAPRPVSILPDIIWIYERPDNYLIDDEHLIATSEPMSGNPDQFVRKSRTDPLAAALQEILDTEDAPLAGTGLWQRCRTALDEYRQAEAARRDWIGRPLGS